MIAAECEPWAKTGGLADVVDALARALGRLPVGPDGRVDVYLPLYRGVPVPLDRVEGGPRSPFRTRWHRAGRRRWGWSTLRPTATGSASSTTRRRSIGTATTATPTATIPTTPGGSACSAGPPSRPSASTAASTSLHLHDWHAAPALLLREGPYADDARLGHAATLLTIHNLAYHGWVPPNTSGPWGSSWVRSTLTTRRGPWPVDGRPGCSMEHGLDLLWAGIQLADLVNTVSPTFAWEALQPGQGMGLDHALRARGDRFFGILNGIDPELWNPATDPDLAAHYDRADPSGKAVCRRALLEARRVRPDRRRRGPGGDRPAGPAEGLRPPGPRGRRAGRRRRAASWSRRAAIRADRGAVSGPRRRSA